MSTTERNWKLNRLSMQIDNWGNWTPSTAKPASPCRNVSTVPSTYARAGAGIALMETSFCFSPRKPGVFLCHVPEGGISYASPKAVLPAGSKMDSRFRGNEE
jgi:hypothetical protein